VEEPLRKAMQAQLDRLLELEAAVREHADPEAVHRMRVATRRLRAARRFVPALAAAGEPLRELADALGRVRDLDVFIAGLRQDAAAAGSEEERAAIERIVDARTRERCARHAELVRALDGPAMGEVRALCERLAAAEGPNGRAPKLIRKSLRRLRRRGRGLRAATGEQLHAVRIAAKRFRYTCEFLAPALRDEIALATAIQDALGQLHDDQVAVGLLLRHLASANGEAGAVGRLIELRLQRRDALLTRFQELWDELPSGRAVERRIEGDTA
jgi:CHAD domain-containing protein